MSSHDDIAVAVVDHTGSVVAWNHPLRDDVGTDTVGRTVQRLVFSVAQDSLHREVVGGHSVGRRYFLQISPDPSVPRDFELFEVYLEMDAP